MNIRDEYYKNHSVCPICKSKKYKTTLVGYVILNNNSKDLNAVHCSCGFIGIVDDLIKD